VREALPDGVALLEVLENQGNVHAWVVRKGREVEYFPLGPAAGIAPLVEDFRAAFTSRDDEARWLDAGGRLRAKLEAPLAAALEDASTLYLALDGALATVPLGLLPDGEAGARRFLLERCVIVHVTGGAGLVMAAHADRSRPGYGLVAFGGIDYENADYATGGRGPARNRVQPLPETGAEADAVAARFRQRFPDAEARTLAGKAATEAAWQRVTPQARYVHAATHGFFDLENLRHAIAETGARDAAGPAIFASLAEPGRAGTFRSLGGWNPRLLSGIVLAGANDGGVHEDGWLTAADLAGQDLTGVELVVLSACDPGRGEFAAGEGVLGLARALTVAGARRFVLPLWPVPNADTRELMDRFYDGLWAEAPLPAEAALRAAQRSMLAEDRKRNAFRPGRWGLGW